VNISDLDDKTVQASEKEGVAPEVYAAKHIEAIQDDLRLLGIRKETHYPQASGHVPDMVALGTQLVQKGYAYEKLRSLYFDLSRARGYGALSGVDIRKIKVGATVDLEEYEKQNPRDFALFKRCRLSELKRGIYVPTDWGNVRPSWHIECAAIAMKYLGESYDIQISSRELTFPHDENMIAIGAALTGKPLARCWLHCERVWRDGGSGAAEGTPPNLEDVSRMGFSGREIRFWLLATHYRKPIVFSKSRLMSARRALQRIDRCAQALGRVQRAGGGVPELDQLLYDLKQGFGRALDDDLNVSAAVAAIFDAVKRLNVLMGENRLDTLGARRAWEALRSLDTVLNVLDFSAGSTDNRVQQLLRLRGEARAAGRWEEADRVRDQLRAANVVCRDAKREPGAT
jgi:cysteinyl-tRNA synthetase